MRNTMKKDYISPSISVMKIDAPCIMSGSVGNEETGYKLNDEINSGTTNSGLTKWNIVDFTDTDE